MNLLLSSYRVILFTVQNFLRNVWLSFITLTIFILTLCTINAIIFVNIIADGALRSVEQKVEVTFYFLPETSEEIVVGAQEYLQALDQVREVRFVSKEEALAHFMDRYAANDVILSSLDEIGGNPFGNALIVSAYSSEDFPFIAEALETPQFSPYVKEKDLSDHETIISGIKTLTRQIRLGGTILAVFFSLVAMLIIFNTIRVAIYVHRDEITIMKLVGANDWFVRGPFLLEALVYSCIAVLLMVAAILLILLPLDPRIQSYFGDIDISLTTYFFKNGLVIFGAQFVGLSFLSLLTTMFAMRRYLRA